MVLKGTGTINKIKVMKTAKQLIQESLVKMSNEIKQYGNKEFCFNRAPLHRAKVHQINSEYSVILSYKTKHGETFYTPAPTTLVHTSIFGE